MIDPVLFRMPSAGGGPGSDMDERFVSRFPCILTEPKSRSQKAHPYAIHVVREWQACVEWLRSAECSEGQAKLIEMLALAGDYMRTLVADHTNGHRITAHEARRAVYGETDRVPMYAMLLHLAAEECTPALTERLRPLAAHLLLALATLIYHDEGARIDLCQRDEETKPPVPSAVAACRLVRQMATGKHADLVERLPTQRLVLSEDFERLQAGLHDSTGRYRGGIDAVCVTLRDARSFAKRRSRCGCEEGVPTDPPAGGLSVGGVCTLRSVAGTDALLTSPLTPREAGAYQRLGLSGSEVRPVRETLRSTHTKGERPGASLSMRIRCQQGMLRDRARANQCLPIRRGMIRHGELQHLVSELWPWMRATQPPELPDSAAEAEGLAMLALILATGAPPEDLYGLPIVRGEDSIPEGQSRALLYGPQSLYLWVRVPRAELDPRWYANVSDLLHPISEGLCLPLPAQLSRLLTSIRQSVGTTGARTLFSSCLDKIEEGAIQVLRTLNARHHCQLQLSRLPGVLPQVIADRTNNWSYAWILCGEGDPNAHTPLVYQTTRYQTLVDAYLDAVAKIFGFDRDASEDSPHIAEHVHAARFYGSALQPLEGVWTEIARELREMIPTCPPRRAGVNEHVAHHNAFVLYTVMLVLVGTGLRVVRDPVESSLDIDWDNGLLFVIDKEAHARGNERYIPLASLVLDQLRAYRRHLNGLADRTAHWDPKAALMLRAADSGADPRIPFLLFLDTDLSLESVRPATLQPRLENVFPAPLNFGRHHIRTYLTRNGCCGEWIDAWMGHEPVGMEAFGPFSALSIADLRRIADDSIEPMLHAHGWVVVEGVPA